jgi:hypothetical protein
MSRKRLKLNHLNVKAENGLIESEDESPGKYGLARTTVITESVSNVPRWERDCAANLNRW